MSLETERRPSAKERRRLIAHLARTTGLASVEELSDRMGVTASTIRRDLAKLTATGRLARTYGGVISLAHPEPTLVQRQIEAAGAKRDIARWAASQVTPGETVLLDAGSTAAALAEELAHVRPDSVTVVTAALGAMTRLAEAGFDVVAIGGRLRQTSLAFVGPLAERAISRMTFDRAFVGADAIDAELGICEAALEQTHLKEVIMGRAQRTYVLAHGAKLGARPFHAWAAMPSAWTLVTDASAQPEQIAPFTDRGIEVVQSPPD